MNETVGAETGFRRTGIVFAAESEADVARYENWLEHRAPLSDRRAHDLSGDESTSSCRARSALEGGALLRRATAAPSRRRRRRPSPRRRAAPGATILTDCAVRGVETGGRPGRRRRDGARAASPAIAVVLAGGAWSRRFSAATSTCALPQLKVRASVMRTAPLAGGPESALLVPRSRRIASGSTAATPSPTAM